MKKDLKVIGYCRVSTDKQDLQRQEVLITKYCEANKLDIVRFIGEKQSGAKGNRSGLQELLSVKKEEADLIIVSELSRISRQDDIMAVISELNAIRQNGLDLLILDTDTLIKSDDNVNGFDIIKLVFKAEGNADERRKIANRMSSGRYTKIVKNHYAYVGGPVPFGFSVQNNPAYDEKETNDKEPKTIFVENKEEIKILEMMYSKIANGYTLHRLAKYMIENGILISHGSLNNYQTLISDILHNELYIGKRIYKGELFSIRPVINQSLYNEAMDALKKNRWLVSYSSNYNPLKGILFCTCGRSLYYANCKQYWYYKCYKKKDDGGNQICSNSGVKAEMAFKAIWKAAMNMMVQEEFSIQTSEREAKLKKELQIAYDNLAKYETQLIRNKKDKEDIIDKIDKLTNNSLIGTFEKKFEELEKETDEIKKRKSENGMNLLKIHNQMLELVKINKEEKLESLSLEFKSEMLHKVIDKAVWCSDRLRKGFLQITYKNGLVETLLIQTDKTHSIILQLPTTIQLDLNERKLRVDTGLYSFEQFLKKFDYSKWIVEETIVDGFKQRKEMITDEELEKLASEALD